jgi:hypothetical protein
MVERLTSCDLEEGVVYAVRAVVSMEMGNLQEAGRLLERAEEFPVLERYQGFMFALRLNIAVF